VELPVVLDALKATEVDDRFRQAAETIYQALIEAELRSVIGALPRRGYLAPPHST
jgi:putative transposase